MADAPNIGFSFTGIINAIVNLTSVMSKLTTIISNSFVNVTTPNTFTALQTFEKPPIIAAGSNDTATLLPEGLISAQSSAAGVGNGADTTEDTLFTYTLPANTLDATNRGLRVRAFGTVANNADSKTIRLRFGAGVAYAITAPTGTAASWFVEGWIIRTGASTQTSNFHAQAGATVVNPSTIAGTEAETGNIVIRVTGQAGAGNANDILANAMTIEYQN